jgi:hypothetical protein
MDTGKTVRPGAIITDYQLVLKPAIGQLLPEDIHVNECTKQNEQIRTSIPTSQCRWYSYLPFVLHSMHIATHPSNQPSL